MNIRNLIGVFLLGGVSLVAQAGDWVNYVNTLQGTNSKFELTRGNTYATTAYPWGMNFWTPPTGEVGSGWIYHEDFGRRINAVRGRMIMGHFRLCR